MPRLPRFPATLLGALVERDIAARRREAALGRRWANMRTDIQKRLERLGIGEAEWCKRELDCDIATSGGEFNSPRGGDNTKPLVGGRQQRSVRSGLWPVTDPHRNDRYCNERASVVYTSLYRTEWT